MTARSCIALFVFATVTSSATSAATVLDSLTSRTSFEAATAGIFRKLNSEVGIWTSGAGIASIDSQHARTGKQCLRLHGGASNSVVLEIRDGVDTSGNLSFHAERWTKRAPFTFTIEKHDGSKWQSIYDGSDFVKVGRAFRSFVEIPLQDASIQRLKFTITSPDNAGLLIDDLQIAPLTNQKITAVAVDAVTVPALVGRDRSPLLRVQVDTEGSLSPIAVTEMVADVSAITGDVDHFAVYVAKPGQTFADAVRLGKLPSSNSNSQQTFAGVFPLEEGRNTLWLCCRVATTADIDHSVTANLRSITFSNGMTHDFPRDENSQHSQRLGVAVRQSGQDDVHTYRIPGLATTNLGTLIGVYDVRRRSGGDLPGDIDVGMSRSTDGGRNWQPMQVIMDMGDNPAWRHDGIGDPAILVDSNTGTIWVAATWSHGNRSWRGSGPGMTPEETGQLMLVRSDDDGITWSKPINITQQVKRPEWSFLLQGPGKGITMSDGTLVFAAQYQDPPNAEDPSKHRLPHSTIIFSKDHGKSWQAGTAAFDDTTEAQVVELRSGRLMLNCRYNRKPFRVIMTTDDMGQTWTEHSTSQSALMEPRACMASFIRVHTQSRNDAATDSGWLLFSNPLHPSERRRISIQGSPDFGETWPDSRRVLLDEQRGFGYSCMTMIDRQTIGILYEGSQAHMTFQRIPLADVTGQSSRQAVFQSPTPTRSFSDRAVKP